MRKFVSIISACSAILCSLTAAAGVYRHDVPVKKYKDLAAEPQFDCVGEVLFKSGKRYEPNGTCVLIGGRYVLTAAHLFINGERFADTMHQDGETIIVYKDAVPHTGEISRYYFRFKGKIYAGKRLTIHPAYLAESTKGECDLAVIELKEEVTDVEPASLNRSFDELNSQGTGVGYGASGKANEPEHVDGRHERIAGQNTIDSLGGFVLNGKPTKMFSDFDHPTNGSCNQIGSARPAPLEYTTAGGDSGGGFFRKESNGSWTLIGIGPGGGVELGILLKTGYYGQTMDWRRVSVFYDWIIGKMGNGPQ